MQTEITPIWDSRTRTCARHGIGLRTLDGWIKTGKVETRKFGEGHKGILVRQASVGELIESLPAYQVSPERSDQMRTTRAVRFPKKSRRRRRAEVSA